MAAGLATEDRLPAFRHSVLVVFSRSGLAMYSLPCLHEVGWNLALRLLMLPPPLQEVLPIMSKRGSFLALRRWPIPDGRRCVPWTRRCTNEFTWRPPFPICRNDGSSRSLTS